MYSVDESIKALALAPARHIYSRAVFGTKSGNSWVNDRTYTDTDHIISAKISIGSGSGGLTIGTAYSAKLTLRLMGDVAANQTDRIIMRVGFYKSDGTKSDPIGLGWFYVDTITRKDNITTIVAYDKMLRGAKIYKPTALTFPCRASAILDDICDKMGVSLRDGVTMPYDPQINEAPTKGKDSGGNTLYYTRREILGYLASIMGGNWFFDAGGHLTFTQFTAVSDTFAAANSTAADISSDAYAVTGITWNINGVPYSRFDDENAAGMLEFANPLKVDAKEPIMGAVEKRLVGLTYHSGTIQRQGCGWFELGDIVTAYRKDGTASPVLITGINYSIEGGAFTEKIFSSALSDSESNYTSGDISGQTVPQSVSQEDAVKPSGDTSPLTSYEFLTDLSVKFNGVTYTAEKDSATGLISKVSDDAGNEFEPVINSGITDVAMHNAVLWAVAMCRGLSKPEIMPVTAGLVGYFDYKKKCAPALWTNRLGGDNITITDGAEVNSECLQMPSGTRGTFSMPYTDGVMTLYAVLKCSNKTGTALWGLNYVLGTGPMFDTGKGRCLCEVDEKWLFANGACDIGGDVSAMENYHVVAVTCDADSKEIMYVDGASIDSASIPKIQYGDTWGLNYMGDDTTGTAVSYLTAHFKMVAFGRTAHTAEQISANTAWLKKYYGI